jgi:CDP-diacylglycerol---glycerol-3-phosphate 3-phosphatidyltransferase
MLGRYRGEVARVADPVARALVGLRLRPNQLSFLGLVGSMCAAAAFAADQRRLGGLCLLLAGALDILDGALARASGQVSPFGAFLDSVLDRYSDLLVLAGLVFLFARLGRLEVVVAVLLALIGTLMVSYTRARAESVDVECRVGFMERGERMLVLIAGALFDLLIPAIWILALGANVTAVHRIIHTWRATRGVLR